VPPPQALSMISMIAAIVMRAMGRAPLQSAES
jgi:hypothetical protein